MHSLNKIISLIGALALVVTTARAVDPPLDGGYAHLNTAEYDNALFSLTTGGGNMANGNDALSGKTTGNDHTAGEVVFTDATLAAGLNTMGFTFGDPIWGDFDGDGDLDLFVDNHYNAWADLYQNNGNGTFTNILATSGILPAGDKHGSAWADFDNDGDLDLFITHGAQAGHGLGHKQDELNQNLGAGHFTDIAEAAGVTNTWGRGRSVAWADYDNDGYVDLLLGNVKSYLVLYRNNGDGTFTDLTAQAGLGQLQYFECAFADYNNDGFPDIFCTDTELGHVSRDILLKNNGDGTFTNVSNEAGILPLIYGRAICWGDYDNDGNLDLFISRGTENGALEQTLYRNNGDGTFTDVTDQAGLGAVIDARAAAWGDFDNDGYLDLYVVDSGSDPEGKGPNYLYRNNGDGTFTDVASSVGVDDLVMSRGRGAAWGDYDNDGFLDLFVTNGEDNTDFIQGPQILYHNGGNGNTWLKIKLVGTVSNRQGLGAKVTIQIGQAIQYREMNGASGHYLSQGAGPLHFGLGQALVVDQVTVRWPSGFNQILSNKSANQEVTVIEPTPTATPTPTPSPPSITIQPRDRTVNVGQRAHFSVTATGTRPLHYQWTKNGANITGATNASYTTPPTTPEDDGALFAVMVTNRAGSVTSNNATLTVH
jgi:enediyne biosynthesis protein E4